MKEIKELTGLYSLTKTIGLALIPQHYNLTLFISS